MSFVATHMNGLRCTLSLAVALEHFRAGRIVREGGVWMMGDWVVARVGGGK